MKILIKRFPTSFYKLLFFEALPIENITSLEPYLFEIQDTPGTVSLLSFKSSIYIYITEP